MWYTVLHLFQALHNSHHILSAQPLTNFDQVPGDENDGSQAGQFLTRLNVVITRQITSPEALGERVIRGKNKLYAITLANQPIAKAL